MRASKNNTIEKFRVVRKALEEIDVSFSGVLSPLECSMK